MKPTFVIGIDLGTTNSVLSFTPYDADEAHPQILEIPQLVAPGTIERRTTLPSFLYLARDHEIASRSLDLPWASDQTFAVGEFARRQAAESPERTISAAKSWLCYSRVDRRQPILPWGAPPEVPRISPVTAAQRYLEHLIAAWHHQFPDAPIRQQRVVLTVPASFDAAARELTREAALAAGLPEDLILLEEPQAALYAWLADTGPRWRKLLKVGDQVLVCDVGGGTTDFTLVAVAERDGELALERLAVGNHLLVGGDNMDLAMSHLVSQYFAEKGIQLNPWQTVSLWHACRVAKETLLGENPPEKYPVTILGRGSRLIGGTVSVEVDRESIAQFLLNGFFPICDVTDRPERKRASGFREIGLPFESDTAVTRHLAAFLQSHGSSKGQPARPTHVLLNGGVFKAKPFQERLLQVLTHWFSESPSPQLLSGVHDLDHGVAKGAAYYGWAKDHGGVRIRGGTARAYYVGIETAGPAVPGIPRPLRLLCVVPRGMEEGTATDVPSDEIGLIVGEKVIFRFFSSSTRKDDRPGDVHESWSPDEIEETDSLEGCLPADEGVQGDYVPVRLESRVNELGMLELWCLSTTDDKKWKLEFSVREDADAEVSPT
ncbi:MAG: Hsp70 family protein [Thermogutta sp.]